jgi:hypothetical protein
MASLPDVFCLIKVVDDATGKVIPNGGSIKAPGKITIRYIVGNDTNNSSPLLTVVGALFRDGVRITPNGQPNVVPAQQIFVQSSQLWRQNFVISEPNKASYKAAIFGDVGNFVNEEDEFNNKSEIIFNFA